MGLAFEQQAKESAKAFAAFSEYLAMGPERSLEAVRVKCGKSSRLIQRWSSRWKWAERVQAYAERLALVEREATEALAREKGAEWLKRQQTLRETEWEMQEKCIAAAKRGLAAFMEREKIYVNLADIARIVEVGSRMGRLASGMSTDKTEVTGEDGGAIRVELTAALNKIYGAEPRPPNVVEVEGSVLPLTEGERDALPGQRARGNPVTDELVPAPLTGNSEKVTP